MSSRVSSPALRVELSRRRNCGTINETSRHVQKQKFRGGNLLKFSQSLSSPAVCFTTTHPPLFPLLPNPRSISPPVVPRTHTSSTPKAPLLRLYLEKSPVCPTATLCTPPETKTRRATRLPSSSVRSAFVGKVAVEKQTKLQATILAKHGKQQRSPCL